MQSTTNRRAQSGLPRRVLRFGGIASVAAGVLFGVALPAQASVAVAAMPSQINYPMGPRSLPEQLSPAGQARLPNMERRAWRVLQRNVTALDQTSLLPAQVVSALHIYRAFRHPLGAAAFRSAILVAWRESRLLPNVVNDKNTDGTYDWGLFQFNDGGTLQYVGGEPGERALRPAWSAKAAARLVAEGGWGPWGGVVLRAP